jgi:hypothetical protein
MINDSIPPIRQHPLDSFLIAFGHQYVYIQVALPLIGLLSQYVTRMRMAPLYLPARGRAKTFRRSLMCF